MGFIPAPPPKRWVSQITDDIISHDDSDSLIDVAEVSPSAYSNRMDFDNSCMDFDNSCDDSE